MRIRTMLCYSLISLAVSAVSASASCPVSLSSDASACSGDSVTIVADACLRIGGIDETYEFEVSGGEGLTFVHVGAVVDSFAVSQDAVVVGYARCSVVSLLSAGDDVPSPETSATFVGM